MNYKIFKFIIPIIFIFFCSQMYATSHIMHIETENGVFPTVKLENLRNKTKKNIKITCISDMHGEWPNLQGGDLLIIAGDLTATDTEKEFGLFDCWLDRQKYKKIVIVAGNHDRFLQDFNKKYPGYKHFQNAEYLCDSGTEFEGFKIWGSPWTKKFDGINPRCTAFTLDKEKELAKKWDLIPDDIDILITHSPPHGILDKTFRGEYAGSISLTERLKNIKPFLHVFGHIHEQGGNWYTNEDYPPSHSFNCSIMNEFYTSTHPPFNIEM